MGFEVEAQAVARKIRLFESTPTRRQEVKLPQMDYGATYRTHFKKNRNRTSSQ
jgi:hypothetical protein